MPEPIRLSTLLIAASLLAAPAASAEASLFQRLGIAMPAAPVSQIMSPVAFDQATLTVDFAVSAPPAMPIAPPLAALTQEEAAKSAPARVEVAQAQVNKESEGLSLAPVKVESMQKDVEQKDVEMTKPVTSSASSAWSDILSAYTSKDGDLVRFDYRGLSKSSTDMDALRDYIDDMAGKSPSKMNRDEELAYWANLYNAITVKIVAENWPVKSIKKIGGGLFGGGPWKTDVITVEGRTLSLDGIEHDTMRKKYKEPRIHYMVNCASIGCPNLMQTPWKADTLEADMTAAAKAFVNSDRGAKVSGGKLTTSSIFKWYKEDFGNSDGGVIAHLKTYADADLKSKLDEISKISGDQYNWDVNAK